MRRPFHFFLWSGIWFLAIGPAFVLPIPFLLPWSYLVGSIPAFLTGLLFALRYRRQVVPGKWLKRSWSGVQVGSTATLISAFIGSIAIQYWFPGVPHTYSVRIEFDTAATFAFMFGLFGAIGGGLAAALMPQKLREARVPEPFNLRFDADASRPST